MTAEDRNRIIGRALADLHEHFDAVQIVASVVHDDGVTTSHHGGRGNWYARRALCQEFCEVDQCRTLAREINQSTPPPEGEEWKSKT